MAERSVVKIELNCGRYTYTVNQRGPVVVGEFIVPVTSIAAAKSGTLTARGSATAGTFTGASHGFSTGQKDISLFWTTSGVLYSRRNVLVGTVSGNAVPFSGGTGDDLPAQDAVIYAMAPTVITQVLDMTKLKDLGLRAALDTGAAGTALTIFSFGTTTAGTYTEAASVILNAGNWADQMAWNATYNGTNPLVDAGASMNTIKISHGDPSNAQNIDASFNFGA